MVFTFDFEKCNASIHVSEDGRSAVVIGEMTFPCVQCTQWMGADLNWFEIVIDSLTPDAYICVGIANGKFHQNLRDVPDASFDHAGYTIDGETIADGRVILENGTRMNVGDVVTVVTDPGNHTVSWYINYKMASFAENLSNLARRFPCVCLAGDGVRVSIRVPTVRPPGMLRWSSLHSHLQLKVLADGKKLLLSREREKGYYGARTTAALVNGTTYVEFVMDKLPADCVFYAGIETVDAPLYWDNILNIDDPAKKTRRGLGKTPTFSGYSSLGVGMAKGRKIMESMRTVAESDIIGVHVVMQDEKLITTWCVNGTPEYAMVSFASGSPVYIMTYVGWTTPPPVIKDKKKQPVQPITASFSMPSSFSLPPIVADPNFYSWIVYLCGGGPKRGILPTLPSGITPLHEAVLADRVQSVQVLSQYCHSVNSKTLYGDTALHLGVEGNPEILYSLITAKADCTIRNQNNQTPIVLARHLNLVDAENKIRHSLRQHIETIFHHLVPNPKSLKELEETTESLLPSIAECGSISNPICLATNCGTVDTLLACNMDINAPSASGSRPLHYAVSRNDRDFVLGLIKRKADPTAYDGNGFTPLHTAARDGLSEMLRIMLEEGASASMMSKNRLTPMHTAVLHDQISVIEMLSAYSDCLDCPTNLGDTPLHLSVESSSKTVPSLLLRAGAKAHAKDQEGRLPSQIASDIGNRTLYVALQMTECYPQLRLEWDLLKMSIQGNTKGAAFALVSGARPNTRYRNEDLGDMSDDDVTEMEVFREAVDGDSALHLTARSNSSEIAAQMLQLNATVNARNFNYETPLHVAAQCGCVEAARVLLRSGADMYAVDNQGYVPLHTAVSKGEMGIIKVLLENKADVFRMSRNGLSVMHVAILHDQSTIVQMLSRYPQLVECPTVDGETALHLAVEGDVRIVGSLLRAQANPTTKNMEGMSALEVAKQVGKDHAVKLLEASMGFLSDKMEKRLAIAASTGNYRLVEKLLTKGYRGTFVLTGGNTAIHNAAAMGYNKVIRILIACGVDLNVQNEFGQTALHIAAETKRYHSLHLLVRGGADATIVDHDGLTALHYAVRLGYFDIVTTLLQESNADVNQPTSEECRLLTPLHIAVLTNKENIVDYLLSDGFDLRINAQTSEGDTALHLAIEGPEHFPYKILKYPGVSVTTKNKDGFSALDVAISGGDKELIRALSILVKSESTIIEKAVKKLQSTYRGHRGRSKSIYIRHQLSKTKGTRQHALRLLQSCVRRRHWQPRVRAGRCISAAVRRMIINKIYHRLIAASYIPTAATIRKESETLTWIERAHRFNDAVLGKSRQKPCIPSISTTVPLESLCIYSTTTRCFDGWVVKLSGPRQLPENLCADSTANLILHATMLEMPKGKTIADHDAIIARYISCLMKKLDRKQLIQTVTQRDHISGNTPLHFMAFRGMIDSMCHLGAAVASKEGSYYCDMPEYQINFNGETPLHMAVRGGQYEVVIRLVEQWGCDMFAPNFQGSTPIHLAADSPHVMILKYFSTVQNTKRRFFPIYRSWCFREIEAGVDLTRIARASLSRWLWLHYSTPKEWLNITPMLKKVGSQYELLVEGRTATGLHNQVNHIIRLAATKGFILQNVADAGANESKSSFAQVLRLRSTNEEGYRFDQLISAAASVVGDETNRDVGFEVFDIPKGGNAVGVASLTARWNTNPHEIEIETGKKSSKSFESMSL